MSETYIIGTDLGGTTIKFGMLTEQGDLIEKWWIPTNLEDEGKKILPDIAASIETKLQEKQIERQQVKGVGLGIPGGVDENGMVKGAVNLGWKEWDVAAELEALLRLPVVCGNDANFAALGEQWKGAGDGARNMVLLTLGTGVGGGVIIDGKIVNGAHGAGGEVGHICVNPWETEPCNCGLCGCLEQYASATGLLRLAYRYCKKQESGTDLTGLTAKDIFDLVKSEEDSSMESVLSRQAAEDIVEEYCEILGRGMAMISATIDPEVFVLGGGVSGAGETLLSRVEKYYKKYAFYLCRETKIRLAELGNDAGIYGAAAGIVNSNGKKEHVIL